MSIRLNNSHKVDIAEKARNLSPINQQLKDLLKARYELANDIRIESLGGQAKADEYEAIAKQIEKLRDKLPKDVLTYNSGVYVNQYMYVKLEEGRWRDSVAFSKPMLALNDTYTPPVDSAVVVKYKKSLDLEKGYRKQLNELQENVYASISKITTVNKLLEVWEEAVELLPPELLQPKPLLPALQSQQLNKLIGLPIKKTKTP